LHGTNFVLIVLVDLFEIFLVDKLDNCDGLPRAILTFVSDFGLLNALTVRNHLRSVTINRHNHDVANVLLVRSIVDGGLICGQARNHIAADDLARVVDLTSDAHSIGELIPRTSAILALKVVLLLLKREIFPLA